MDTKQLTQYLKLVSQLESSLYIQQQTMSGTKSSFNRERPVFKANACPKPPQKPEEVKAKELFPVNESFFVGMFKIFPLVLGLISLTYGLTAYFLPKSGIEKGWLGLILGFVLIGIYIWIIVSRKKNAAKENDSAKDSYLEKVKYYNEVTVPEFNKKEEERKGSFNTQLQQYNKNEGIVISRLSDPLNKTKTALQKLYDKDIIFDKYRNLVAMTTIYEYFASGRCTSLTGPDGAYNLYENELRQNRIITELTTINQNLQQIQNNQYVLYTELKKGNEQRDQILNGVEELCVYGRATAINTAMNSYCTAMTALAANAIAWR